MIQNFFNTVQKDLMRLAEYTAIEHPTKDQEQRVGAAALRTIAVCGMAFAAIIGVAAFTATTPLGAILTLATAVTLYAISHDVFVIGLNTEKGMVGQVIGLGKGLIEDFADMWNGDRNIDDAPRHFLTEGTFLRPVWDVAFATLHAQTQG